MTKHSRPVHISGLTATLIALLVLGACQVRQEVQINRNGSGKVDFSISLAPYFTEVVDQLQQVAPPEEGEELEAENIFQVEQLRKDFAANEEVSLEALSNPNPQELHGTISFESIERALTQQKRELESGELFSFTRDGERATLDVLVNYATFRQLLEANPSFNSPLMENFGPPANRGLSDGEYLDMMEYALGPESRKGIKESELHLRVNVEGRIVSHKGGSLVDENTILFRVPLLDLLILDEALRYSVSFE
jgi:hypothetical protein